MKIFVRAGMVLLAVVGATALWCLGAGLIGAGLDFAFDFGKDPGTLLGIGSVVLVFAICFCTAVLALAAISIRRKRKEKERGEC